MRRREFITLLGSTAATWPLAVRAQQSERIRRIGVLMNRPADDVVGAAMVSTFKQSLQQLGWRDGHNIRMDVRWGANDPESERRYAVEIERAGAGRDSCTENLEESRAWRDLP
jgi:putative ABC transport system substrate-binding protein